MKPSIVRTLVFSGVVVILLFGGVISRATTDPFTVTASPTTYKAAGDQIIFEYKLTNTTGYQIHSINYTDSFGQVPCPLGADSIDIDAQGGCLRYYTVTATDIANGQIVNSVTVTGDYGSSGCGEGGGGGGCGSSGSFSRKSGAGSIEQINYSASITVKSLAPTATPTSTPLPAQVFIPNPVLYIKIAGSPTTFTGPDQAIAYSYTLTNGGNVKLGGGFTIDDTLVHVACPSTDTLDINKSIVCTASYQSTMADVLAGAIKNTSIAHAKYDDGTKIYFVNSSSVSVEIPLTAQPSLNLVKTADLTCFTNVGETIHYLFTIKNTGNVPLAGPFQILDTYVLSNALKCPDITNLKIGDTIICNGSYKVTQNDIGWDIWNKATINAQYQGQTVTSNEASVEVCYIAPTPTEPPSFCAQFTNSDTCTPQAKCYFDYTHNVCKNK